MLFGYFTEQPLNTFPADEAARAHPDDHPARDPYDMVVLFSNKFYDRSEAVRLYHERLDEYRLAEQVGFDAIMLNEHHGVPYCMQSRTGIMAAALAAITSRVKLIQLGTPLPIYDNPVQVAEELAMIDMFSKGRLVSGIVRGGGHEQLLNDANPAYNQARFREAHDLIIKTWTQPGPFRWDGEHYHVRVVNPWALPLQEPHPPIFVPGVSSTDTIHFAADHGYPYIALATSMAATKEIWRKYDERAAEAGYQAGTEHHGYLGQVHVAETEEEALANAMQFTWPGPEFSPATKSHWVAPTGYSSWEGRQQRKQAFANLGAGVQELIDSGWLVYGTPKQVVEKLRGWMEEVRPGSFMIMGNNGRIGHEASKTCIRLLGEEVLPQLRKIARSLDIRGPFDVDMPVSRAAAANAPAMV